MQHFPYCWELVNEERVPVTESVLAFAVTISWGCEKGSYYVNIEISL